MDEKDSKMSGTNLISLLSIVVPVYGCSDCLAELVARLKKAVSMYVNEIEIILVDDCGPGNSWQTIKELGKQHPEIKGIKLSRNFGQYPATHAGLEKSTGDWIVVMDCDLQDPPEEIPKLIEQVKSDYHVIRARRIGRQHAWYRKILSKAFYKFLKFLTDTEQDAGLTNFGLYSRKSIDALLSTGDYVRFFPTLISWVGFSSISVDTKHSESHDAKSSYSINELINLAINVAVSFSDKPLWLMVKYGMILCGLSLLTAFVILVQYFIGSFEIKGYTSLILSIWIFGSATIALLGLVGLYVGKAFEQVKKRPIYLIEEIDETNI